MIQEFREFINRGNFVELAVAFVMGLAAAGLVTALVDRLIMPLIALAVGQPNFDAIGTFGDGGSVGAVGTALVNFLLVALVLFLVVRGYNRLQRRAEDEPAPPQVPSEETLLLREIRDSLRERD